MKVIKLNKDETHILVRGTKKEPELWVNVDRTFGEFVDIKKKDMTGDGWSTVTMRVEELVALASAIGKLK